jgi:hypothetical protein
MVTLAPPSPETGTLAFPATLTSVGGTLAMTFSGPTHKGPVNTWTVAGTFTGTRLGP